MCARRLTLSFFLMLATIVAGLVIRFAHLGLPSYVVKYGGSMLLALMIYWIALTVLPTWRIPAVVLLAGSLGTVIERHLPSCQDLPSSQLVRSAGKQGLG
jgi:hypothetical protein